MLDNKCFGLGVQNSGSLTCANYFRDCINGGNISSCKNYMKDTKFWLNAADEVSNMLPEMAYQTLKSFEFETYDEFSKVARRSFKMVQTWQQWLDTHQKSGKLNKQEVNAISANVKLQEYLNALILKVNNNPAILNKDYYGEKPSDLSQSFKGTLLAKRGLKFEVVPKNTTTSSIINLSKALQDSRNRTRVLLGTPNNLGVSLVLTGGAPVNQLQADIILGQFQALKERLRQNNKDLAPADEQKIKEMIDELRQKEAKLSEFIIMTDRYADLIQAFGQQDSNTLLTIDHLQQFTKARDNYFSKVSKKQISLMSIIQSISDKVSEIDNKSSADTRKTTPIA